MTLQKSVSMAGGLALLLGVSCALLSAQEERPKPGQAKTTAEDNSASKNKRIVYPVRYGGAKDLAAALGKHFKGDAEVQAVTETGGNYLLISAAPALFDEVLQTLQELDRAPKTVSVDVWVAEVIAKKSEDGKPVEGEKEIDEKDLVGTINEVQKKLDDLVKNGRIGGLKHIQLNALENQTSSSTTGENKPYIVGTTVRAVGGVSNQIAYRNVGTQVRATPRIMADRSILLELKVEDSRVNTPEDGIGLGVNAKGEVVTAAEFTTSTLESKLTVAPGKAVAAEGVKSNSKGKQAQVILLVGGRIVDSDAKKDK
jgi:type II secretory pathway component GspD/PulD (secretin)